MKEIWKDIKGYEGQYQVSNFGNVKSLSRKIRNGKSWYCSKEKILIPMLVTGYKRVGLRKEGKRRHYLVHRLVLENFIGDCSSQEVCNHKDGNKLNNFIENLEWVTQSENLKHAYAIGLKIATRQCGEKNYTSKLTNEMVRLIRHSKTIDQKELSKIFNVSVATINRIINRVIWAHL